VYGTADQGLGSGHCPRCVYSSGLSAGNESRIFSCKDPLPPSCSRGAWPDPRGRRPPRPRDGPSGTARRDTSPTSEIAAALDWAERAVLLKIYAHCIDGRADAANKRIADAHGAQDT
jgi:hypothetical protein